MLLADNLPLKVNPYYEQTSANTMLRTFEPAIVRMGYEFGKSVLEGYNKQVTFSQFVGDVLTKNIVIASQIDKLDKRFSYGAKSEDYMLFKKSYNYVRQYHQSIGKEKGMFTGDSKYKRTPFYRNLRNALYFSNEKEVAKEYWLAFDYVVTDLMNNHKYTYRRQAEKDAHEIVMQSIRHMNPIKISDKAKGAQKSKRQAFYEWVEEKGGLVARKEMEKAYKKYTYMVNTITNIKDKKLYKLHFSDTPFSR